MSRLHRSACASAFVIWFLDLHLPAWRARPRKHTQVGRRSWVEDCSGGGPCPELVTGKLPMCPATLLPANQTFSGGNMHAVNELAFRFARLVHLIADGWNVCIAARRASMTLVFRPRAQCQRAHFAKGPTLEYGLTRTHMNIQLIYSRILKKIRGNAIKGSLIDRSSKVESGSTLYHSKVDRHSFCGYDCSILNCEIGSFCSIGNRVSIGGVAHPAQFVSTSPVFLSHKDSVKAKFAHHPFLPELKTRIGNDVWIGEGVFVKAGVQVGHGAIIGMGSVVTKDVAPYAIVAGNPARLIRMRFEDHVIAALLKMAWWDLPESELRRVAVHFNDPDLMLRQEGHL